jgi:hypothetical protein
MLLSTLLQDILHPSHHLLNVLLQIENKLGLSNKKKLFLGRCLGTGLHAYSHGSFNMCIAMGHEVFTICQEAAFEDIDMLITRSSYVSEWPVMKYVSSSGFCVCSEYKARDVSAGFLWISRETEYIPFCMLILYVHRVNSADTRTRRRKFRYSFAKIDELLKSIMSRMCRVFCHIQYLHFYILPVILRFGAGSAATNRI